MAITEDIGLAIKTISVKTGKTTEELMKQFETELQIVSGFDPTASEENKMKSGLQRFISSYRKALQAKSELLEGVFIGYSAKRDMVGKLREEAMAAFNANKQLAIEKHYVKMGVIEENGTMREIVQPLYRSTQADFEKLQDWQIKQKFIEDDNGYLLKAGKKYSGNIVPINEFRKSVYGIAKKVGTKDFVKMELQLRGDNTNVAIPLFTRIKFGGFVTQGSTTQLMKVNDVTGFSITPEVAIGDEEIKKIIDLYYKDSIINLMGIDNFLAKHNGEWSPIMAAKVTVTEIVPLNPKNKVQVIRIEDDTMPLQDAEGKPIPPITCFLAKDYKINFPEKAEVIIIGSPSKNEKGAIISIYGVYVPKAYRNSIPITKPIEQLSNDEVIDVWNPNQ